jgi:C-terminal processing protease CtpA/Prc
MLRSAFVSALGAAASATALPMPTAGETLPPDQMAADLNDLAATLVEVGADPFRTSSERAFRDRLESTLAQLSEPADERRFYLAAAALIATLNDGHVRVAPNFFYAAAQSGAQILFPLFTAVQDGGLYVLGDATGAARVPRGSRITAIENVTGDGIVAQAEALVGAQTPALRRALTHYSDYVSLMYGDRGSFAVSYRTPDGIDGGLVVPAVTREEIRSGGTAATPAPGAIDIGAIGRGQPYAYAAIAGGTVGYIAYRACRDPAAMERFAQDTFAQLQAAPPRALIVDVRANAGGDSRVSDVLLRYLTAAPYAQFGGVECRASARLKREYGHDKYASMYGERAWNAADGTLIDDRGTSLIVPGPNPLRFAGPRYVLIGPRTFSSGLSFASAIKDFGIATIVGEETGEPVVSTGEVYATTTRFSRLAASFTTKVFFGPKPHPDGQGVVPDVTVVTTLADQLAGRDPVLAKTLALIGAA